MSPEDPTQEEILFEAHSDSLLLDQIEQERLEPPIRGIEVNYCVVCPRKLWLWVHGLEKEHGSELVELGRILHEKSYSREPRKNLEIEGFARIDFTEEGIVHEVKRSPAQHRAHVLQLAYYLWLLRQRGVRTQGILHFPQQRKREIVDLTPELVAELEVTLARVREIRSMTSPPKVTRPMKVCRSCAYEEFCWGEDQEEGEEV